MAHEQGSTLEQLIFLLRSGNPRSLGELAEELRVSPALLEAMLEDLTRRGYLREASAGCCGGGCKGCPFGGSCAVGAGKVWSTVVK